MKFQRTNYFKMKLTVGDCFQIQTKIGLRTSLLVTLVGLGLISILSTSDCKIQTENEIIQISTSLYVCSESLLENLTVADLYIPSEWSKSGENLTFSLKSGFEQCTDGSFEILIETTNTSSKPEALRTDDMNMDLNGVLRLNRDYYHPYEYCVYEVTNSVIILQVCNASCQGNTPCISKCCSLGKLIDYIDEGGCVEDVSPTAREWKPKLYNNLHTEVSPSELAAIKPHIKYSSPKCTLLNGTLDPEFETLPSVDVPEFGLKRMSMRLRKDGSLIYLGTHHSWEVLPWDSFCIEHILVDEIGRGQRENNTYLSAGDLQDRPVVVFKCVQVFEKVNRFSLFYVIAMFTSAFFLLITGTVYAMLWNKHNIHGWTILFHVTSMFFLYVFLGISHTFGIVYEFDDWETESTLCVVIGVTVHFFFVSTFCWLTLLNFDLWSTFRSVTPVGERSKGVKRFVMYNVFAWGVGAIMVTVGVTMDYVYPDVFSEVIVPRYGQTNCFMAPWAMGYYIYSVIGVLMIVNFVFIGLTAWTIYKFRETTRMIQHSKSGGSLHSFKLFSKLFVIMGVTWVLEIVSWLDIGEKTTLYWALLDCVNIFQSIAIFVIFICKRKTVLQLQQKFPLCNQTWSCCGKLVSSNKSKTSNDKDPSTGTTSANANTKNRTSQSNPST